MPSPKDVLDYLQDSLYGGKRGRSVGASGTFLTVDLKQVTVENGIITTIVSVPPQP